MEETDTNVHSVNIVKPSNQPTALERLRKSLEPSSNSHQQSPETKFQSSPEPKLPSAGTTSETRNLWKLVRRLAENKPPSSSIDEDEGNKEEKPPPAAAQRRFHSIPSIVERLRSSNLTGNEITENLSEEEKQAERKKRLAVKWKMAVRTASTKSHAASPSLMNDIKKLESELDEFKDELRQYHQISIAFTPPQYQRSFIVKEMDEEEFHTALQKEKQPKQSTPSASVRSSLDLRSSTESTQRRHSISSPRSPRPTSGKSVSSSIESVELRPERPKSANNSRGYGSRWFLPVDAWSSFEKPQQPEPLEEEEVRVAFKRMDNINVLHSSKAFKQFLLENEQRVPHFLDTVPIPSKPNANATLPSTSHAPTSKSNSTSPQMLRRRKSISGPSSRPSTQSTTSSFRSTSSSTTSSLRAASSPPVPKRQLTWSASSAKSKPPTVTSAQKPKRAIERSASVGSFKSRQQSTDKPRIITSPAET